jgi:hypothetical protein
MYSLISAFYAAERRGIDPKRLNSNPPYFSDYTGMRQELQKLLEESSLKNGISINWAVGSFMK